MRQLEHRAAFKALLRHYLAPLRRLTRAYAPDAHQQEDLFSEVALALWTALPQFRGEASERTWLYRVAHNTAIRFVTRQVRQSRHEQPGDLPYEPVSMANPEQSAIDADQRQRLWTTVQALPLPARQVVVLHLEGLSAAEIEAVTGLSAGSVATRLTRARQRLAAIIQGEQR